LASQFLAIVSSHEGFPRHLEQRLGDAVFHLKSKALGEPRHLGLIAPLRSELDDLKGLVLAEEFLHLDKPQAVMDHDTVEHVENETRRLFLGEVFDLLNPFAHGTFSFLCVAVSPPPPAFAFEIHPAGGGERTSIPLGASESGGLEWAAAIRQRAERLVYRTVTAPTAKAASSGNISQDGSTENEIW
jgi:hypothetical protein